MRARLIRDDQGLWILFNDGQMKQADREDLRNFLCCFKLIRCLNARATDDAKTKRWDKVYLEMSDYPGETMAYVTDAYQLVIDDFNPFNILFEETKINLDDVLTVPEFAKLHKKSPEQVKVFCRTGRIPGAQKIGQHWLIPSSAAYPADNRFRTKKI